ncbi:PAAR-like domain-containing protein [Methylobacterium sp. Leaf112]|uniref:PAAR-like domain-containing protein n=1 Tax=Methylobacterium sp. Leaf112 TaxID=1736258 RepID=UPI0006F5A811|nr:PAAR-like domain-containing protein [Methylobacterium sp. Leaf112]KQP69810.1 hypothetical protein ASF52_16010 [Methylobacterium sp. Leaf112]
MHGDEAGTGGGVKSGTHRDITEPIGHAPQVRAEGSPVIRNLDRFWMNRRNTVGDAVYVKDQRARQAPEDDDPLSGSLRRGARRSQAGWAVVFAIPDLGVLRS